MSIKSSNLGVGDWVEVRSESEILATLDDDGRLHGMPFMPEMFAFCGKRFRVYKRAHKTCDTVFPVRGRRVSEAVHLETRCDGSAHGGCQASCLLFWKDAWLKPLADPSTPSTASPIAAGGGERHMEGTRAGCSEALVWSRTQSPDAHGKPPVYSCQATRLPYATAPLEWWDVRQYLEDLTSGNVNLWDVFCGATYFFFLWLSKLGIGLGRPIRWAFDHLHPLWRGVPFPRRCGTIPEGMSTPAVDLSLQPGDLVRIKPYKEILQTLNSRNRNRGLYFDAEEVPYCGQTHRVAKRVTRIIEERTGKMLEMKTPCYILDSVICQSRYSECRLFCPRSIHPYWREIWLERVEQSHAQVPSEESSGAVGEHLSSVGRS